VSGAGDVNGDGFADIIVGADRAGDGGAAYVVFGTGAGFDAGFDLSSLDGSNGFRIDGEGVGGLFCGLVSGAGDLHGGCFGDLIVGDLKGFTYVVFGKASSFASGFAPSDLDGSNGFRIDSSSSSVSPAGDVNGDGIDDIVVTAAGAGSYVLFGSPSFDDT